MNNSQIFNERWRLASVDHDALIRYGLFAIICALAFVIFNMQGNTADLENYSRSIFAWLFARWRNEANFGPSDYSHGYIVPIVSLGVIYWRRKEIMAAPKKVSIMGLSILILGLVMQWLAAKSQHPRISAMSLIVVSWGIPYYFFGWRVAKLMIFPAAYLIFCIPLNFLDSITFPLRMLVTMLTTGLLNGLGIMAEQDGTGIHSLAAGGFDFDVADPCSGLKSLLAMTALTAVYAFLTQKTILKQWILFLSAVPLAIVGNIARITTIAIVAEAFGAKIATDIYHDYSGYVVFSIAIGLMVFIGALLNMNFKEKFGLWKQDLISPIS